jgi:hypothetical protein
VTQRLLGAPPAGRTPDPASDEFGRTLAGFDGILPAGDGRDAVRGVLLRTLLTDGRNSDAYHSAVGQLMTAITRVTPV